jgi:rhodanese-related sulfurtransferase
VKPGGNGVNDDTTCPNASAGKPKVKKVLLEGVLVGAFGAALALVANAISPRGLVLTRNYFPAGTNRLVSVATTTPPRRSGASTNQVSTGQMLAAQLREKGLQLVVRTQAEQLVRDPRLQQGIIVFIDARDDERYQAGHIPGAYQFDPYRPEKYLTTVLPVCQAAEEIVFYCYGSDCEDSQMAALTLRDAGIPNQKLFVYVGGMAEWATNALPVEIGPRNSGNLRNAAK